MHKASPSQMAKPNHNVNRCARIYMCIYIYRGFKVQGYIYMYIYMCMYIYTSSHLPFSSSAFSRNLVAMGGGGGSAGFGESSTFPTPGF